MISFEPWIRFRGLDSQPAIRVTIENRAHSLPPSGKVFIAIRIGMAQNSPNMQWLMRVANGISVMSAVFHCETGIAH
jgi:hypothetical protein